MAHSLSAKKRVRQAAKKNDYNRSQKASLKALVKNLLKVEAKPVAKSKAEAAKAEAARAVSGDRKVGTRTLTPFQQVQQKLDRLADKGVVHKNTAARRKSRLSRRAAKAAAAAAAAPAAAATA